MESKAMTRAEWKLDDGRIIDLVTPNEFESLPHGTVFVSIDGERVIKSVDDIDDDTRAGFLAFGLERES
jgi:hypothetical protein